MKISLKSFIATNTLFQTILDLVRLKKAKMHKGSRERDKEVANLFIRLGNTTFLYLTKNSTRAFDAAGINFRPSAHKISKKKLEKCNCFRLHM